jgi:hypothetical protein
MTPALRTALCALALAGCGTPDPPSAQDCAAFATDALLARGAPTSLAVVAVAPSFEAGRVRALSLADLTVRPLAIEATGDTVVRPLGDALALLHRVIGVQDNLTLYQPRTGAVCQVALVTDAELRASRSRPFANAHDAVALDAGHLLVTRHSMRSLAVVDVADGVVRDTIDLAPWQGSAPLPYPDALAWVGDEVWVTLERDDSPMRDRPTQPGLIARIDPRTRRVTGTISLLHPNPVGAMLPTADGRARLVTTVGSYNVVGDGAVESIDVATGRVTTVVDETELGGNIDAMAVVDAHRLALRVTAERHGTSAIDMLRVVLFDTETRVPRTLIEPTQWGAAGPVVVGGRIFVSDPGQGLYHVGAGVRVFSPEGTELRSVVAMDPGLMPYDVQPSL